MKILYVEDDMRDVDLTLRVLNEIAPNFLIETASTIRDALERISRQEKQYDLVLTDLHLPDGDGLSLLSYIRQQSLPIPVVVITGAGDEDTAVTALKAGADDYVVKRGDYIDRLPLALEDALHRFRAQISRLSRPLNVLYAERNKMDADLTRNHFLQHAPNIRLEVVTTGSEVINKVQPPDGQTHETNQYDVLLFDYRLPGLNALEVVKELCQNRSLEIPVVLVTGQGNEEVALQAIKLGATSYLIKNPGYLYRLPGDLENAFYRAELIREHEALRKSEERYRDVVETQTELICRYLPDTTLTFVNDAYCRYFEKTREELIGAKFLELIPEHARENAFGHIESLIENPRVEYHEHEVLLNNGEIGWQQWVNHVVFDATGKVSELQGVGRDVTARRQAEESLRQALLEVERLKDQLHAENVYLREEVHDARDFGEIVGQSEAFKNALREAEQVAPTDTTALVLGETGTGKELLAHAIHKLGGRADRPLIKVNCASLPANLIESELFGHEKGAFTGALTARTGRFELADKATIFLDEIGEFPLELQAKLLRVLQEGEFERLGSSRTIKVDVRVIAATNRDLEEEVRWKRFRSDLYYRLNVFPIRMPSLRERGEDIRILAKFFMQQASRKMGKRIEEIPEESLETLESYGWPGNIRELKNVIERAVIITRGDKLQLPEKLESRLHVEPTVEQFPEPHAANSPASLEDIQRQHIIQALNQTYWRVDGPKGAAALLGINPGTLRSRMKRFGIHKHALEE
jgi:PAS domain S-box-containing protein